MKNLPIGISTLSTIMEGNMVYVDKFAFSSHLISACTDLTVQLGDNIHMMESKVVNTAPEITARPPPVDTAVGSSQAAGASAGSLFPGIPSLPWTRWTCEVKPPSTVACRANGAWSLGWSLAAGNVGWRSGPGKKAGGLATDIAVLARAGGWMPRRGLPWPRFRNLQKDRGSGFHRRNSRLSRW
jgi:hypothetical protein